MHGPGSIPGGDSATRRRNRAVPVIPIGDPDENPGAGEQKQRVFRDFDT